MTPTEAFPPLFWVSSQSIQRNNHGLSNQVQSSFTGVTVLKICGGCHARRTLSSFFVRFL